MNLADLLLAPGAGGPDEVAVYVRERVVTRGELAGAARRLEEHLRSVGLRAGTPVAVMLPNGPELVAALFGVWAAELVYVPLNPRLTGGEIERMLAAVGAAAMVGDAEGAARFEGDRATVPGSPDMQWDVMVVSGDEHPHHGADVALVQFTSGTTGPPKPVLLRHSTVLQLMDGVIRKLGTQPGTRARGGRPPMPNLVPVSLSLWAGIYNVLFAFRVGAPVVLMERFDTKLFAELIRRFQIRSTVLPPAAMTALADDNSIGDVSPLRFVRSITAPLSPLQARRFSERFGVAVLNSYGQTELGGEIIGWNASDVREHGETKLGAVGRPHDGVELRIVDDVGAVLASGQAGELWVRTPAMSGDVADLADRISADGWFRTGDVARIDPDGWVWIEGRVSDVINRGGLKVFPGEVEEVLRLSVGVGDAAVVGVPDPRLGEVPWAFLVPAGAAADAPALERLCREHLAPYKVPVQFVGVDELPRNEVGKLLGQELVQLAHDASGRS